MATDRSTVPEAVVDWNLDEGGLDEFEPEAEPGGLWPTVASCGGAGCRRGTALGAVQVRRRDRDRGHL